MIFDIKRKEEFEVLFDLNIYEYISKYTNEYNNILFFIDNKVYASHKEFENIQFEKIILNKEQYYKNIENLDNCIDLLLKNKIDRYSLVVIVGGGEMSDLLSFVCSIYKRGVDFTIVPTTLLSAVDACIGGKTAINYKEVKNMIGNFALPKTILINTNWFSTLDQNDYNDGFAEIIKYGYIYDKTIIDDLMFLDLANRNIDNLVKKCIKAKMHFVINDFKDKDIRQYLNFGHTLGHSLEIIHNLSHGQAVFNGMEFALFLSFKYYGYEGFITDIFKNLKEKFSFKKVKIENIQSLVDLMKSDKKNNLDNINFILLKDLNNPIIHTFKIDELKINLEEYSFYEK